MRQKVGRIQQKGKATQQKNREEGSAWVSELHRAMFANVDVTVIPSVQINTAWVPEAPVSFSDGRSTLYMIRVKDTHS